jgi:putative aldouronate transport system permease protein
MGISRPLRKETPGRIAFVVFNTIAMSLVVAVVAIPILKVVVDSFDERAAETIFRFVPERFTIEAYRLIISRQALYRPFLISLFTTVTGTAIAMTITSLYAYGLAQRDLPGKRVLLIMALITMVFRAGMIPLFLVVRDLRLMNTLWAVLLVRCVDAYYLLLLRNFFLTIPGSIMDAAEIDGCSPLSTFLRVVLPLSKPGLAAIGLFYVVFYWNQFFDYIIYIQTRPELHNFQVFLRSLVIETDTQGFEGYAFATQSLKNAAVVASIIPVMILYPFVQRYFVKGINLGSIKG